MLIDQLPEITTANDADEMPIEQGTTTRKIKILNLLKNVLKLTGGILTGNLEIHANYAGINAKATNMPPASGSSNSVGFRVADKDGNICAIFADYYASDGNRGAWIAGSKMVNGSRVFNSLNLYVNDAGERSVTASSSAAWRKMLGLGDTSTGELPVKIAQGGTNSTGTSTISTVSQIATAGPNVQITSATHATWGKLAQFNIAFKATAAITSGTVVCTLVSGKRPATTLTLVDNNLHQCTFEASGNITIWTSFSSGQTFSIRGAYLLT